MQRLRPDLDVVLDILKSVLEARPESDFIKSLLMQYRERGGLSKKQLQGLYGKASKIDTIPSGKIATLEAIILRKPLKSSSIRPTAEDLQEKQPDQLGGDMIEAILQKYPQHKRVLFFKMKFDSKELLSANELAELQKFSKLLTK